jgi:hypothetical protein
METGNVSFLCRGGKVFPSQIATAFHRRDIPAARMDVSILRVAKTLHKAKEAVDLASREGNLKRWLELL